MKFIITMALVIAFAFCAKCDTYSPSDSLISAIIQVESHGNDFAIGDTHLKNKAYGCMQIRKPVLVDVNKRFKTHYTEADCFSRKTSKEIFKRYMSIYKPSTDEECARMWNGGPNGHKKSSTECYWNKVLTKMNGG